MSRYKGPDWQTLEEERWGRRPRVLVVSSIDDTKLVRWKERDRLHIAVDRIKDDRTLVEWWDDDARQAIEDGFLDPKRLHESAYAYGLEMGAFKERRKR